MIAICAQAKIPVSDMFVWPHPPVDEEGSHAEGPEDEVDVVVGQEPDLPLPVTVNPVREDVVVGDVPEEAGQAAQEAHHPEPDWGRASTGRRGNQPLQMFEP